MNTQELRRLLIVVAPAALVLGLVAILVAFAIEGPRTLDTPRIGKDHWHARYQYIVCGVRQPNAPQWHAGVHTHRDGIIHIHPFTVAEEGSGSRLVKWFEYGGGTLTSDQVRLPGDRTMHSNGDRCPDGSTGTIHVYVTPATGVREELADWTEYIPHDGDTVTISFGPE